MQAVLQRADEYFAAVVSRNLWLLDQRDGRHQSLYSTAIISCKNRAFNHHLTTQTNPLCCVCVCVCVFTPALASDTALEIALLDIARLRFMISSNSASLRGARDESMSLKEFKQMHWEERNRNVSGSKFTREQQCSALVLNHIMLKYSNSTYLYIVTENSFQCRGGRYG